VVKPRWPVRFKWGGEELGWDEEMYLYANSLMKGPARGWIW